MHSKNSMSNMNSMHSNMIDSKHSNRNCNQHLLVV